MFGKIGLQLAIVVGLYAIVDSQNRWCNALISLGVGGIAWLAASIYLFLIGAMIDEWIERARIKRRTAVAQVSTKARLVLVTNAPDDEPPSAA